MTHDTHDLARFVDAQRGSYERALTEIESLRSSATLFAEVSPAGSVFHRLLDKYFAGEPDAATLQILARLGAGSTQSSP